MSMDWDRGRDWDKQGQSAEAFEEPVREEFLFRDKGLHPAVDDPIGSDPEEERLRAERLRLWLASA